MIPPPYIAPPDEPYRVVHAGATLGVLIMASQDRRQGLFAGVQFVRPEPRLKLGRSEGRLVFEPYALYHHGGGKFDFERNATFAVGALVSARWRLDGPGRWFADLGWGLQLGDRVTLDLDTRLNSTPSAALVWTNGEAQVMLRYMHMSNAGTNLPNAGQNHLHMLVGWRF